MNIQPNDPDAAVAVVLLRFFVPVGLVSGLFLVAAHSLLHRWPATSPVLLGVARVTLAPAFAFTMFSGLCIVTAIGYLAYFRRRR